MLTVRDDIVIAASMEAVFEQLDHPEQQPEFTPSLAVSELQERLPNGGSRVRYVYRILGLDFEGEVRATDYAPPERIVWSMTGDLRGTIRWYLEPMPSGTRFTYAATYAVPGPSLLRPLATPLIRRYNERELADLLRRFKHLVENVPAGA